MPGRARILVVDDDEAALALVSDTLSREDIQVTAMASPREALEFGASGIAVDLVVSDVSMPDMNGFQLRDEFRKLDGHGDDSFLFMSAADDAVEKEIATLLGSDPLLFKPFSRDDLRRMIRAALRLAKVVVGPVAEHFEPLLREAAEARSTGVATVVRGPVVKRVVIQEGTLVFAASNDRRDLIGQAFLRAGLISERDLVAAFQRKSEMESPAGLPGLALALAAMRKISIDDSRRVFEQKIREAVLDVFLWQEGAVEYIEGPITEDDARFPLSLDVGSLVREGLERRRRWAEVKKCIPDSNMRFFRPGEWPAGFPRNGGEKALAKLVEAGRTMAEIRVEMHGQDYAVGSLLAAMVSSGTLELAPPEGFRGAREVTGEISLTIPGGPAAAPDPTDASPAPPVPAAPVPGNAAPSVASVPAGAPEDPLSGAQIATAIDLIRDGAFAEAREVILAVLADDPLNALARARLEDVESELAKGARAGGLQDSRALILAVPIQKLVGMKIPANDAFVLSRLAAGKMTVGALLQLCPFPEHEVLRILQAHLESGVLR